MRKQKYVDQKTVYCQFWGITFGRAAKGPDDRAIVCRTRSWRQVPRMLAKFNIEPDSGHFINRFIHNSDSGLFEFEAAKEYRSLDDLKYPFNRFTRPS